MNLNKQKPSSSIDLITIFIVLSALVIILGTLLIRSQKKNLLEEKENELAVVANLKVRQIQQWRHERWGDAILIQDNLSFVSQIHDFFNKTDNKAEKKELITWMNSLITNFDYLSVNILDMKGRIRLSIPEDDTLISQMGRSLIPVETGRNKIMLKDLHHINKNSPIHMDLLIPMVRYTKNDSTVFSILDLRIDPRKTLFPLLMAWPSLSKTSETLIIRRDGDSILYLNDLKYLPNSSLSLRKSINDTNILGVKAVLGFEGIAEGVDYRNVAVIAAMKKVPDSPWFMVSKVDKAELESSFYQQLLLGKLLIVFFISAFGALFGWMIWHKRVRYYRERYENELHRMAFRKHFDYILKYANDTILLIDNDLKIIEANDRAIEIYGYTRDELIGMKIMKLRPPYMYAQLEEQIKILNEKSYTRYETIHICKDGTTFPTEISARLVEIEGVKYYQSIGRDITERRKIEGSLKALLERFNLATKAAKLAVWDWDIANDHLIWDERVYELFGVKRGDLPPVYASWLKIIHPDDLEDANNEIEKALKGEKEYDTEFRILNPDRSIRYIKAYGQVVRDEEDKPTRMIGINYDITEQKQAEIQIEESNSLLLATLESTADGILVVDLNGKIVQVNRKFTEMWEIPEEIISSRDDEKALSFVRDHLGEPDSFLENVRYLYDNPESVSFDLLDFKDGRTFERYSQPQKIANEIVGRVWSFRDITQRKTAEEQLISAKDKAEESDRLKTAFLHNISHEIRTPMNAIIGFTSLLDEQDLQPEIRKQYIDIIYQSSNQLLSIISDIVDISNIETGQTKVSLSQVNINTLIRNLYEEYSIRAAQQDLSIHYKLCLNDNEAVLETDGTKLLQILSNLLNNSLKFTQKGKIEFGYALKKDSVEFMVCDTGIGISKDKQSKIFDRFYQVESSTSRQYSGTGLGLSICRAYAVLLGGSIRLESEPGAGSTFYLSLPYEPPGNNIVQAKEDHKQIKGSFKGKTILIAEDDDINYLVAKKTLEDDNFNLIRAKNGREAVEICRSNSKIDLVLLDLKMPVMDGIEAMGLIHKFRPSLPFIALTAYAFDSDKKNAIECGCADYISKPFSRNELLEVLIKHL
jgi:PAS domain S-box-containing protein